MKIDGKVHSARRISFELYVGEILEDKVIVSRSCSSELCVNPDHVILINGSQHTAKSRVKSLKRQAIINKTRKLFQCGHAYTEANFCKNNNPLSMKRECKTCRTRLSREWKRKRRAQAHGL